MNIQCERIQQACETLKLDAVAIEWQAQANKASQCEPSYADFLESLLQIETAAKRERAQATLLKFAGLPAIKRGLSVPQT